MSIPCPHGVMSDEICSICDLCVGCVELEAEVAALRETLSVIRDTCVRGAIPDSVIVVIVDRALAARSPATPGESR